MAIHSGLAEVVALVYGYDQRTSKVQYGGSGAVSGGNDHSALRTMQPVSLPGRIAVPALPVH